jgi:hypothetical protein
MPAEVSPESKLYVKEEIEKIRKEIKEEVEKANSKATKIFTSVALVVGLVTAFGVYGLAKNYVDTAVRTKLDAETVAKIEAHVKRLSDLKTDLEKCQVANSNGNGYAWIGGIKFVWGYRECKKDTPEAFYFEEKFPKECVAVIPALPGLVYRHDPDSFLYQRLPNVKDSRLCFVAIGH